MMQKLTIQIVLLPYKKNYQIQNKYSFPPTELPVLTDGLPHTKKESQ